MRSFCAKKTVHELGLEQMEDIAGCVGKVVKRMNKVEWDPTGSPPNQVKLIYPSDPSRHICFPIGPDYQAS